MPKQNFIYLHIGFPKTASTRIQRVFEANRDLFEDKGFIYPKSPGIHNHIELICYAKTQLRKQLNSQYASPKLFEKAFIKEVSTYIQQNNSIVLSNEHLSRKIEDSNQIMKLNHLLSKFNTPVKIILYLRRQDNFMLSWYNTYLRGGGTKQISDIVFNLDYRSILKKWMTVFPKESITVRIFEPGELLNANILEDFLSIIDFKAIHLLNLNKIKSNPSLSCDQLKQLFLLNNHLVRLSYSKKEEKIIRREAVKVLNSSNFKKEKLSFSTQQRIEIQKPYTESNKWVAKNFLGRKNLFLDPKSEEEKNENIFYKNSSGESIELVNTILSKIQIENLLG